MNSADASKLGPSLESGLNSGLGATGEKVWIYDTTLRDGAQREGLSLSLEDKLRIAAKLDGLGVDFIEGGWPGANPKDVQFFWQLREQPLARAKTVAFCSTRRPNQRAEEDPMLQAILAANTGWVTLFGKSWDLQVTEALQTTLDENLAMIGETIAFFRSQGRRVIYDAEHWFDGYKHNRDYALATLVAAAEAGADWLVFCDTNGGSLPHEVSASVRETIAHIQSKMGQASQFGIHSHNDGEMAVANAIVAVQAGCRMVQGTINGYGERCGNANLCSIIPNLELKLGFDCISGALAQLTSTSRFVSELVNLAPDDHAAFVGLSAFAHKGGIHVSAVERNPLTYEHIRPEQVGNLRRIVVSDQSGLSNVLAKARTCGIDLDKKDPASRAVLKQLKILESEGYQFEAAEASFELLLLGAKGLRRSFFDLKDFQIHCIHDGSPDSGQNGSPDRTRANSRATIKVCVAGQDILETAEGNGPVSALDAALRRAIGRFYPAIDAFQLTDYKVRILDGGAGTSAKTRVLVESSNGQNRWTTVGVSENIIEASYRAVVEGLEYGLMQLEPIAMAPTCQI
jgi:2-isopropylmalate synthase